MGIKGGDTASSFQMYMSLAGSEQHKAPLELINSLNRNVFGIPTLKTPSGNTVTSSKGLFTWSGGPRTSGVGFFCFDALRDTKQKKPTPLDQGPQLHVNRV